MTNQSYLLKGQMRKYLLRIPKPGLDAIIDRKKEQAVYEAVLGQGITEEVLFFDADTGYKVSVFVEDSHNCDPKNWKEVEECIRFLKDFHKMNLTVNHSFDVFGEIKRYENVLGICHGAFPDEKEVRDCVLQLQNLCRCDLRPHCLCHVDPQYDNFLMAPEGPVLIDWEYAGVSDPYLDVAMFCIYANYSREETDRVIDLYLDGDKDPYARMMIYAFMSSGAYLWVLWSEIKRLNGEDFFQYEKGQYEICKKYYSYAMELYRLGVPEKGDKSPVAFYHKCG